MSSSPRAITSAHMRRRYSIDLKRPLGRGAWGITYKGTDLVHGAIHTDNGLFDPEADKNNHISSFDEDVPIPRQVCIFHAVNLTDAGPLDLMKHWRHVSLLRLLKKHSKMNRVHPGLCDVVEFHLDTLSKKDKNSSNNSSSYNNDPSMYIVSEFVVCDLHQLLRASDRGGMTDEHNRWLVYQLLCALNFLHSAGVVHGNIKPSHVRLDSECTVKITDFYDAKCVVDINRGSSSKGVYDDEEEHFVAARWYRSPEAIVGADIQPANDVWGVGCILFELLHSDKKTLSAEQQLQLSRYGITASARPLAPGKSTVDQLAWIARLCDSGLPSQQEIDEVNGKFAKEVMRYLTKEEEVQQKKFEAKNAASPAAAATATTARLTGEAYLRCRLPDDVPDTALDLLRKLLAFSPRRRITVAEALKHPYVARFHDDEEIRTMFEVVCDSERPISLVDEFERTKEIVVQSSRHEMSTEPSAMKLMMRQLLLLDCEGQ